MKPMKKVICKDGNKCETYKWKYGHGNCKHGVTYSSCKRGCKPLCCTKQYAKKKYRLNDYHAAKKGLHDKSYGKNTCSNSSSSSSVDCPPGPKPSSSSSSSSSSSCSKKSEKKGKVVKVDRKADRKVEVVVVNPKAGGACKWCHA